MHAVLGRLPSVLLPPLREDLSPLDGAGLRWNLHRDPRLLRPGSLLRLLLQRCKLPSESNQIPSDRALVNLQDCVKLHE